MSQHDSILLFKSTAREDYKRLLLTALSAPVGTLFQTYYKSEHVAPDLTHRISAEPNLLVGKKAVLIFFNLRPDTKRKFYPIRNFTVKKAIPGEVIQFFLTPNEYYKYSGTELHNFNSRFQEQMTLLPPQGQSWAQIAMPQCIDDIQNGHGQEIWKELIEHLDQEEIGRNDDFRESVFFYLENIHDASAPIPYDSNKGYYLTSGKQYALSGFHYKPRTTKESFQIKFEGSEDIRYISNQLISILPGRTQPFEFAFTCKPAANERQIELRIFAPEKENNGNAPRHQFPVIIRKQPLSSNIEPLGLLSIIGGLIGTSLAQTLIPDKSIMLKTSLSILGSLFTLVGILFVKKEHSS